MTAPLYHNHEKPLKCAGHYGLWFERFFDQYDPRNWEVLKPATNNNEMGNTYWLLKHFNNKKVGDQNKISYYTLKQKQLVENLQGQSHAFKASWHFVTGMGNPHPVENGFAWHPTLGVPYLTGAAVKGLVRTFIETQLDETDTNNPDKKKLLLQWFGSDHKDPDKQSSDSTAGELIFFDAIPTEPVKLGVDIMTPHMGKWYEKGGSDKELGKPEAVPADWHDPVPVAFLVATDITLLFSFAIRPHPASEKLPFRALELDEVKQALTAVLEQMGAGGKTATGYGGMQLTNNNSNQASFSKQEEKWEKASFQYQKSNGEIIATGNKKRASVKGDNAKDLLSKLPEDKRKMLEKNRLVATAVVESQGNMNILIRIETS